MTEEQFYLTQAIGNAMAALNDALKSGASKGVLTEVTVAGSHRVIGEYPCVMIKAKYEFEEIVEPSMKPFAT